MESWYSLSACDHALASYQLLLMCLPSDPLAVNRRNGEAMKEGECPSFPARKAEFGLIGRATNRLHLVSRGNPHRSSMGYVMPCGYWGIAVCLYKDGKDGRSYTHLKELPKD